jgi:hypothetical protein
MPNERALPTEIVASRTDRAVSAIERMVPALG